MHNLKAQPPPFPLVEALGCGCGASHMWLTTQATIVVTITSQILKNTTTMVETSLTIKLYRNKNNYQLCIVETFQRVETLFFFLTLGLQQLFLHWYVFKIEIIFIKIWIFSLIFNLCVCVHIKVIFEMIFYLTILNLSLYDVKYKYIFNIKYVLGLRFWIIFYLKKFTIFVHVHVRYVFKLYIYIYASHEK